MTGSEEVLGVFDIHSDRLYSAAIDTWWVAVYIGFMGVVVLSLLSVILSSVVVPSNSSQTGTAVDSAVQGWAVGKSIALVMTAILVIPAVRGLNWTARKMQKENKYLRLLANPVIAILLYVLPSFSILIIVGDMLPSNDAQTIAGDTLIISIYLIFSALGAATAASWIYASVTLAEFFKNFRLEYVRETFDSLWQSILWLFYIPRMVYNYGAENNANIIGASQEIVGAGINEMRDELESVDKQGESQGD